MKCNQCRTDISHMKKGTRYCSGTCRNLYHNSLRDMRNRLSKEDRECLICNDTFTVSNTSDRVCCGSKPCITKYQNSKKLKETMISNCVICNEEFTKRVSVKKDTCNNSRCIKDRINQKYQSVKKKEVIAKVLVPIKVVPSERTLQQARKNDSDLVSKWLAKNKVTVIDSTKEVYEEYQGKLYPTGVSGTAENYIARGTEC